MDLSYKIQSQEFLSKYLEYVWYYKTRKCLSNEILENVFGSKDLRNAGHQVVNTLLHQR